MIFKSIDPLYWVSINFESSLISSSFFLSDIPIQVLISYKIRYLILDVYFFLDGNKFLRRAMRDTKLEKFRFSPVSFDVTYNQSFIIAGTAS